MASHGNRARTALSVGTLVLAATAAPHTVADDAPATSQPEKHFRIARLEQAPVLDGRLDDAVWQQATLITDLHQVTPVEYSTPSRHTELRLFYTDRALYVAARMHDDPALVTANVLKQGASIYSDDTFGFSIDPHLDRRGGYVFSINPNGVRADGILKNITGFEANWDGIWHGEARIDEHGWSAEIELPFSTVSFNPAIDTWGFNFERIIARHNEWIGWSTRERQMNPTISGTGSGLFDLQQGLGLDVVPAAIARRGRANPAAPVASQIDPSLDVFYRITPQLNAALTVNTDFSAADVDSRQVNLSRFSLFFPEKRDFFLRDADLFDFGRLATNGRPFFSRRIGLNRFGTPIDLDYGAKLSGRTGPFNLGSLYIRQAADTTTGVGTRDIFVGRASANVLAESSAGVIVTHGDPQSERDNTVYGADFSYRNSRLPGNRIVEVNGWVQHSDTEGLAGDDKAWGVTLGAPNTSGWRGLAEYKRIEANFAPALGFVNRAGIEDYTLDGGYMWRFGREGRLRSLLARADHYRVERLDDGGLDSSVTNLRLVADNHRGDTLTLQAIDNREVLRQDFTIFRAANGSRQVRIAQGDYRFTEGLATVRTNGARRLSGSATVRGGEYYDGSHLSAGVSLSWSPWRHLNATLSYSEDHISLQDGGFVVRLVSAGTTVAFNSRWSWTSLVQYDNVSEVMGLNSRLHWQPRAGRNGYLVVNHGREDRDGDSRFRTQNWDVSLKYSHTLRY